MRPITITIDRRAFTIFRDAGILLPITISFETNQLIQPSQYTPRSVLIKSVSLILILPTAGFFEIKQLRALRACLHSYLLPGSHDPTEASQRKQRVASGIQGAPDALRVGVAAHASFRSRTATKPATPLTGACTKGTLQAAPEYEAALSERNQ